MTEVDGTPSLLSAELARGRPVIALVQDRPKPRRAPHVLARRLDVRADVTVFGASLSFVYEP